MLAQTIKSENMKYDVAIIGGGPAGYTAAESAAKKGLSTILFEKNALGGVCLNEGCVPTKTLLYSAKTYDSIKHASKYAVSAENASFDYPKIIARKNAKAMERMKPQLEVLQARYADDKQRLQQEQMALYKKEKYSTMGMCLPTIVTFVVFFVVFAGFRQMVGYQFAKDYKECVNAYNQSIAEQIEEAKGSAEWSDVIVDNGDGKWDVDDVAKTEKGATFYAKAKENAQQAVYDVYYSADQVKIRSWLWIKNIFVSDNWSEAVPDFATVTGQKGMATSKLTGITIDEYNDVMGKLLGTGGYGKNGKWNGLLILPVLSIALSILSTTLLNKSNGQAPAAPTAKGQGEDADKAKAQQQTAKMMQYVMPLMIGVFAIFYSGAFALYMFTSSACAILFQLSFNLIAKLVDKSRERKAGVAKR